MKKSNIIYGLTCIILSGISLYIAINFDATKISGVFYGLTGALVASGIVNIAQYFYWKRHNEKYEKKLEIERIEQQDELKQTERYLGYTNAEGEGLSITLSDNDNKSIDYNDLLMLVNQLWIAGAEAVSVNDERIVSTTEIVPVEGKNIFINTKKQSSPYVIKAIGNKKHLESALTVKNGFINEMLANGKSIKYKVEDKIEIPKYKSEIKLKFGR